MSLFSTAGLARASSRHPWRVIGMWLVILVLGGYSASTIGDVTTTDFTMLNNPESVQGLDIMEERMGREDPLTETVLVTSTDKTVDDPAFRQVVVDTTANIRALDGIVDPTSIVNYYELAEAGDAGTADALLSDDKKTTLIPVTLTIDLDEADKRTDEILDAIHTSAANGIEVIPVGDVSINHAFTEISEEDLIQGETFGILAALVILVVVFGALVAAGVPILLAIISISIATGLAALYGRVADLSFFVTNMITMIGLAVGIDYALFIISRYREERRLGREKLEAIEVTGGTASKAVLFSGLTVVFALLGLFMIPTTIFRSLGLGAVLVVIVAVVVMLTLIPALLALIGDNVNWPRRRSFAPRPQPVDHGATAHAGFWGAITRIVMGKPVISLVLSVLLLGALAIPYFDLNTGFSGPEALPESEVKRGYEVLASNFEVGRIAPVQVVVDASPEEAQAGIDALGSLVTAEPTLAGASVQTPQWNEAGDLALVNIDLTSGPNDQASLDAVEKLRAEIVPAAFGGSADVYVTGDTAFNKDFFDLVDTWTPIVFIFVLALSFILLTLAFRSIVVPAKAILMNLLSVGAAYGLLVLVFQKGVGTDLLGFQESPTIEAWLPFFLFCVLFGLSMDYHVFLLSRVREHYDLTHDNRESVAVGLQSTARIITGAALIMVAVFSGFAMGRLVMFQQMGFGLGVAVLLDATIVRSILVPSAMALLGDRNWYLPSWLKWLPDLRVEGTAPPPVAAPVAPEASPAD